MEWTIVTDSGCDLLPGDLAPTVRLRRELPPLARLTRLEITDLPPVDGETEFVIVASHGHAGHSVLVSPDVGICEDCLRDMHTPGNPRFGYAFPNSTNCGPRYTITRSIPYDRATTSMACRKRTAPKNHAIWDHFS